jgi:hypothetical protein
MFMSTFTKKQAIEAVRKVKAQTRASIAQTKRDDKLAKETAYVLDASRHYDTLCEIAQRANVWHDTTYRKATDELYELLADCYQTTADIRKSSVSVMKSLNLLLKSKKLAFNEGTSLETKAVRVVFGDIGKRAQIYARVLRNAREQSVEPTVFAIWLAEQGGVEAVRKQQKGKSPADVKAERVETAEKALPRVKAQQLSNAPKVDGSDYVLALVQHTNGKQRIVGFCDSVTLIKEAMAKLADAAEQQASAQARADLERENRKYRQQITQAASLTAKAA